MRPSIVYSGFCIERAERRTVQHRPHAIEEVRRILAERQQRDAARIVDVLVERAGDAGARERRLGQRPRRVAAAERQKLHEQAAIAALRLAVLHAAFFADVGRLGSSRTRLEGTVIPLSIIRVVPDCLSASAAATLAPTPTRSSTTASPCSLDMGIPLDAPALDRQFRAWLTRR